MTMCLFYKMHVTSQNQTKKVRQEFGLLSWMQFETHTRGDGSRNHLNEEASLKFMTS